MCRDNEIGLRLVENIRWGVDVLVKENKGETDIEEAMHFTLKHNGEFLADLRTLIEYQLNKGTGQ